MSNVRIFLLILLLSAVLLEAAPGRWDPHEGILTNSKLIVKLNFLTERCFKKDLVWPLSLPALT